eukprot:COSAG06_NODE_53399_length_300_cov_0.835821_1_plen_63_part_10
MQHSRVKCECRLAQVFSPRTSPLTAHDEHSDAQAMAAYERSTARSSTLKAFFASERERGGRAA